MIMSGRALCMTTLFSTETLKPPPALKARRLVTSDGAILRVALARPSGVPKGTVVLLPGRAEYIERHYETLADLLLRDYAVATLDWRGQGLSSRLLRNRLKGHIRSFAQYDADLLAFMRQVVLPDCPPPYIALAHSMGGLVLLRSAWRHPWFERAVLTSPLVKMKARRWPEWLWRVIAAGATWTGLGGLFVPGVSKRLPRLEDFETNALCSDQPRFCRQAAMLAAHPELGVAGPTLGWLHAAIRATDMLHKVAQKHRPPLYPLLMLAAGRDALVDREAARQFAAAVGDIAFIVLHGARHDLWLEGDHYRNAVWAAFDAFMDEGLAGLPSPRQRLRPLRSEPLSRHETEDRHALSWPAHSASA